jgi:hypothetical protein
MIRFDMNNRDHQSVIKAIAHLQFTDDFKRYSNFLQSQLDALRIKNDNCIGDQLKWNQGKCQWAQDVLNLPEIARNILKNSH